MANEQTSVPLFVADTILTAAQQNISAATGVPVFATTVTRDAAFGGANKALAEGQLCYLSATDVVQYYDGAAWATVGPATSGLTLISATTIGTTVSSVAVTNAFSATYDSYFITVNDGISSANGALTFIFTGSTTGYYATRLAVQYSDEATSSGADNNAASFTNIGVSQTSGLYAAINVSNPFIAKPTYGTFSYQNGGSTHGVLGFINHRVSTSYTGFTFTPSTGTLTGGTIKVYGYANS